MPQAKAKNNKKKIESQSTSRRRKRINNAPEDQEYFNAENENKRAKKKYNLDDSWLSEAKRRILDNDENRYNASKDRSRQPNKSRSGYSEYEQDRGNAYGSDWERYNPIESAPEYSAKRNRETQRRREDWDENRTRSEYGPEYASRGREKKWDQQNDSRSDEGEYGNLRQRGFGSNNLKNPQQEKFEQGRRPYSGGKNEYDRKYSPNRRSQYSDEDMELGQEGFGSGYLKHRDEIEAYHEDIGSRGYAQHNRDYENSQQRSRSNSRYPASRYNDDERFNEFEYDQNEPEYNDRYSRPDYEGHGNLYGRGKPEQIRSEGYGSQFSGRNNTDFETISDSPQRSRYRNDFESNGPQRSSHRGSRRAEMPERNERTRDEYKEPIYDDYEQEDYLDAFRPRRHRADIVRNITRRRRR